MSVSGDDATGLAGNATGANAHALVGNAGSGEVGSVTQSISWGLSGVSSAGEVGPVTNSVTVALTGTLASGEVDTVVYGQPLTGVTAAGSAGNIDAGSGVAGAQASGDVGTPSSNITVALTGNASSAAVGTITGEPTYSASIYGNSLEANVQSMSIGERLVQITGSRAMGALGQANSVYWRAIDTSQTPHWELVEVLL